jgi:DNA-binding NarL/FixJ family response regulator
MIRVLIVASSAGREERLTRLLRANSKLDVLTLSAGARAEGEGPADLTPDVIVADWEAGEQELARDLLDWARAREAVILLSEDFASATASDLLRAGVKAVLSWGATERELGAAVEAVAAGLIVLAPDHAEELSPSPAANGDRTAFAEALTRREIEVLGLLAEGLANKQIADRLAISEHTAKFHVASIMGKLGAASRTEAVTAGIRRGLIII